MQHRQKINNLDNPPSLHTTADGSVADQCPLGTTIIRERLGPMSVGNRPNRLPEALTMPEEHLTPAQCEELAKAIHEDAACLPPGSKRDELLKLAKACRALGEMKRMVLREVN